MRKIALEEHFSSPDLAGYSHTRSSIERDVFRSYERQLLDFDGMRLEAMDKAGIELAVLSVTTPGVQAERDTSTAIARARQSNDFLARQIEKHPKRYAGFAHLPLQSAEAAADELARCVKELGFKGAMVNGHTSGKYLDDEMYWSFWDRVQELGVPVYLHPCDSYDVPHVYQGHPELLGATWSWTMETASHALRLVFAGTFERFPEVTLILGHMGETLPYLLWRLDNRSSVQSEHARKLRKPPSEVIKRNIVITTTGVCSHPSLLCAVSALGENNVMFSVDYPYEDSQVAAQFIEAAPLNEAVRAKICHGNAERLLRIPQAVAS